MIAWLVVSAAAGASAGVQVTLDRRGAVPATRAIVVVAEPPVGVSAASVRLPAAQDRVTLPPGVREWTVTCAGEGVFCPRLRVPSEAVSLELPVFQASLASGRITVGRGQSLPRTILVQGRADASHGRAVAFEQALAVTDGAFDVVLPQTDVDLRLSAHAWAPVYLWGLRPRGERTRLGTTELRTGGSLSGLARDGRSRRPLAACDVRLSVPEGVAEDAAGRARLALMERSVRTDARGFFQVAGLPPGRYRLQLAASAGLEATLETVEVLADAETRLEEVELWPAARLTLSIDPPVAPGGGGWVVELFPRGSGGRAPRRVVADPEGRASLDSVPPGLHGLTFSTQTGARLLEREVDVAQEPALAVTIPLTEVRGTVTLGGRPLAAEIRIETGSFDGVDATSDDEGRYHAWIRRPEHRWLSLAVESGEPEVSRRVEFPDPIVRAGVIQADVALSDARLAGVVTDEERRPVGGATVTAAALQGAGAEAVETVTDAAGRFGFAGLDPVLYAVSASHSSGDTETVEASPSTAVGEAPAVTLVLRARAAIEATLLSVDGAPVPSADVEVLSIGGAPCRDQGRTDASGRTRLRVGRDASQALVTVKAMSHGLWSGCLPLTAGQPLVIALPALPSGTLSVRTLGDPSLPPARRGRLVILTADRGVLDLSDLVGWRLSQTGALGFERPAEGEEVLRTPGVAPGAYVAVWSDAPLAALAREVCGSAASGSTWKVLDPGGEAEIAYDVREQQQRSARGGR